MSNKLPTGLHLPQEVETAIRSINPATSRRGFLKASGALFISAGLSITSAGRVLAQAATSSSGPYPHPDFHQLDTWIVIHPDNTATFFVGKTDGGQGTGTAYRQLMCDELDIPYASTRLVMGSTDTTPDQGGSGGSDGVEVDGWPMRYAAAEARRTLIELASVRLNAPITALNAVDGKIVLTADPSRAITYAQLIGGQRFDVMLDGRNINSIRGVANVKPVQDLRVIGQSIPRYDIPAKVDGSLTWAVDVKLPGMVHARNVRPPLAGANLQSVDEASVSSMPGFVAVVREGNYLAVVFEREEQAINGARALVAQWAAPSQSPFPASEGLFDYIRKQNPTSGNPESVIGDPETAFASAARIVSADYEVPFQGHTAIGPAHALADPSGGQLTLYSNDMKSYGMRLGVAKFLNMPEDQVRVVYMDGPQVYGRTAADDVGFEAAYLANKLGRPVRVQWMRDEETAWDTKGPAYAFTLRGALDGTGNLSAIEYEARALDYNHVGYNDPDTVLIAQLMGRRPAQPSRGGAATPSVQYGIANQRYTGHVISLPMIWETPLRCGNLRDPNGPQVTFAFESFIDEMAAAANADPVQFRLNMIANSDEDNAFRKARSLATVQAAADAFGWETRPSPNPLQRSASGALVNSGRGIAYTYRSGTVVATIAEVEVNRDTGRIFVKRLVCAHDCGLVINPTGLQYTVECGMLHGLSRALWEEVQFDTEKVTSVDWATHPTMRHSDTPESIEVVIVNGDPNPDRADLPHYGAGEASHKPMIAAIANAVFDATGVRLRRVPFRQEIVLEALRGQS